MVVTIKSHADGQLAAIKTTLYTATGEVVTEVTYVNTGAGNNAVNLYLCRSGSASRRLIPVALSLEAVGGMMTCAKIAMSVGDKLEGDSTAANEVDYTIEGIIG